MKMLISLPGYIVRLYNTAKAQFSKYKAFTSLFFRKRGAVHIKHFSSEDIIVIKNSTVILSWEVKNAYKVVISSVGEFINRDYTVVKTDFDSKVFHLTAFGIKNRQTANIIIRTVPELRQRPQVLVTKKYHISVLSSRINSVRQQWSPRKKSLSIKYNPIQKIAIPYPGL